MIYLLFDKIPENFKIDVQNEITIKSIEKTLYSDIDFEEFTTINELKLLNIYPDQEYLEKGLNELNNKGYIRSSEKRFTYMLCPILHSLLEIFINNKMLIKKIDNKSIYGDDILISINTIKNN